MSRTLSRAALDVRPGVFAELQKQIDAFAASGGDLIPLQIGDTCRAPPKLDSPALADLHPYGATAGLAELRAGIAAHMISHEIGPIMIEPATDLSLGVGATHAIFCGARSILNPGDEVLLSSPYWPLAHGILSACGARITEVPFSARLYADHSLDAGALFEAALTPSTKAIYVINPNNPDGFVMTRAQCESIAELAIQHDLWVISDEVYAHLTYDRLHVSLARLPGMQERTLTAFSFSKSYAMAGARVGAIVGPSDAIAAAKRMSVHSAFNVPVAMQRAAIQALSAGDAWLDGARKEYRAARDATVAALEKLPVRIDRPHGATYVMIDFSDLIGDRNLTELLTLAVTRGVLLAPGEAFGAVSSKSARLCFTSVPIERVLAGIDRLAKAIDDFRDR